VQFKKRKALIFCWSPKLLEDKKWRTAR